MDAVRLAIEKPRNEVTSWMSQINYNIAVTRIEEFTRRFGEDHFVLACHAAFPIVLTPDLLYRIWTNFVPQAPWIAVADVLLSRVCHEVGHETYEMDVSVRNLLLRELLDDKRFGKQRLNDLARFLIGYVAHQLCSDDADNRELAQAQRWTALTYTQPDLAAHELELTLQDMDLSDKVGLVRVSSLINSLAEPLSRYESLLIYAQAVADLARGDLGSAATQPDTSSEWLVLCRRLVPDILRSRDWQLVEDQSQFIKQVHQAVVEDSASPRPGTHPETVIRRATVPLYCRELYQAIGERDSLRQSRAFEEIRQYAEGVAHRYEQDPSIIEACVQHVMTLIWQKHDEIRKPESLLLWVQTATYHEIKNYRRQEHPQREVPVDEWSASEEAEMDDDALQLFWETLVTGPPPLDVVIGDELRKKVWHEVRRVLSDNPRYEAIIIGHYLYGLSLPALAEMLRISMNNIYVLKSRALARLRADQAFHQHLADVIDAW